VANPFGMRGMSDYGIPVVKPATSRQCDGANWVKGEGSLCKLGTFRLADW
jgi:hypothetical protein